MESGSSRWELNAHTNKQRQTGSAPEETSWPEWRCPVHLQPTSSRLRCYQTYVLPVRRCIQSGLEALLSLDVSCTTRLAHRPCGNEQQAALEWHKRMVTRFVLYLIKVSLIPPAESKCPRPRTYKFPHIPPIQLFSVPPEECASGYVSCPRRLPPRHPTTACLLAHVLPLRHQDCLVCCSVSISCVSCCPLLLGIWLPLPASQRVAVKRRRVRFKTSVKINRAT